MIFLPFFDAFQDFDEALIFQPRLDVSPFGQSVPNDENELPASPARARPPGDEEAILEDFGFDFDFSVHSGHDLLNRIVDDDVNAAGLGLGIDHRAHGSDLSPEDAARISGES